MRIASVLAAIAAVGLFSANTNAALVSLTVEPTIDTGNFGNAADLIDGVFGAASDNVNTGGSGNGQFWADETSGDPKFVGFSFTLPAGQTVDSFVFSPRRRVDGGNTEQFAPRADDFDVEFATNAAFGAGDIFSTTTYSGPTASTDVLTSVPVDSSDFAGVSGTVFVRAITTLAREPQFNLGEFGVNVVPEPSAIALSLLGIAGVVARRRR